MTREEAEKALDREIDTAREEYSRALEMLDAIERVYRKDGGDFSDIGDNFTVKDTVKNKYKACLEWRYYGLIGGKVSYYLAVHYTGSPQGTRKMIYFDDHRCLDRRDPEYKEMEKTGRLIKCGLGFKDCYLLTPNEIMEDIKAEARRVESRLSLLNRRADEIKVKGLEVWEHIEAISKIKNELSDDGGKWTSVCCAPLADALQRELDDLKF